MHVCTIIRALQPVSHKAAAAQAHRLEACTVLDAISEWLDGCQKFGTDHSLSSHLNL